VPERTIRIDTEAFQMLRRRAGLTQKALAERAARLVVARMEKEKAELLADHGRG
jgi:DNA-binding XRE family transcriptional regulator